MLDFREKAKQIQRMYEESPGNKKVHGLIIGEKGSGKTSLCKTMVKPVLIHSFDPGGTEVLRDGIEAGDILVDTRFENDDMYEPTAYRLWEQEYNELGRLGMFEHIGTYVIDSLTTYSDALLWQIMKKEGRVPARMSAKTDDTKQGMRIQDWGTVVNAFVMLTRSLSKLPCHTFLLGHIAKEKDEVLGRFVKTILLPGQSRDKVPINCGEYYVLTTKNTPKGLERKLLVKPDGDFSFVTNRIGGDKVGDEVEPDIRKLFELAGLPTEDKPRLTEVKADEATVP